MKAIIASGYGGPEVLSLGEQPEPSPSPNQVKIRVHFANISKADTMMRTGKPLIGRLFTGLFKPKHDIPGTGFSGVIESLGSEVNNFQIGDRVYGESTEHFSAHAQFLCINSQSLIRKIPNSIELHQWAPLCDGPLTAYNFLYQVAHLQPKQHIVINGASGSIGSAAVQLAKQSGAYVTAICSGKNQDLVQKLGADEIVLYDQVNIDSVLAQYDVFFDTVGNLSFNRMKLHLKPHGIYMSPVLSKALLLAMFKTKIMGGKQAKFSATGLLPANQLHQYLEVIEGHLKNGSLNVLIDKHYLPDQIRQAHEYIDSHRKKGSVILDLFADKEAIIAK